MVIRPLIQQDRHKIHLIVCQGDTFNESEIQVAMELVDEVLENPANRDYSIYSAVHSSGEFAGYICYGPIPMTLYCYDLYWVAVDRRFSKRGVAGRLLEFMEAEIRCRGGKHVYVDTSSTPAYAPARSFYKKHGYRPICTLDDFFKPGDHKIIFRKELS